MIKKIYGPMNVEVDSQETRRSSWKWSNQTISGIEYIYDAIDKNFNRLNRWSLSVRVHQDNSRIIVQPQTVPGKQVFAGLERRPVVFIKATKNPFRTLLYCKVNLSDPTWYRATKQSQF